MSKTIKDAIRVIEILDSWLNFHRGGCNFYKLQDHLKKNGVSPLESIKELKAMLPAPEPEKCTPGAPNKAAKYHDGKIIGIETDAHTGERKDRILCANCGLLWLAEKT